MIYVELAPELAIWVSGAQCSERFAGHQKIAGSTSIWGSEIEIVFLRLGLDERSSIISDISKLPRLQHITHRVPLLLGRPKLMVHLPDLKIGNC